MRLATLREAAERSAERRAPPLPVSHLCHSSTVARIIAPPPSPLPKELLHAYTRWRRLAEPLAFTDAGLRRRRFDGAYPRYGILSERGGFRSGSTSYAATFVYFEMLFGD